MIEKKTLVTAFCGVLAGGLLLSGGMAFASNADNSKGSNFAGKIPFLGKMMEHRGGMAGGKGLIGAAGPKLSQGTVDQLVKEGAITPEKAAEIKTFIDKTDKEAPKGRMDLCTELVKNNILTQEQVDTIKTKMTELGQKQKQQKISDSLKALAEKGTITQEQSDKILKGLDDAEKNRQTLAAKMENMTLKEIRQYMQDNKEKPQNPIKQLVTDGVITQVQADAFQKTMSETAQKQKEQRISDSLKALVDKGTVTQEQADKILTKLDTITDKAQNPISQLVADNTITKDQANSVREVLFERGGHRGGKR